MIKRNAHRKHAGIAGIILSLLCLFATNLSATGLRLNGNWSSPFGDDDGPWNLGQSYNLSLNHDLSSAIKMSGNFRYSTNERQGLDKTETMSPSLTLGLTNDLFRISLNGTQNQRWSGDLPKSTTTTWNSTIASNLADQKWPQLRLSYGESNSTNDASPTTQDTDDANFSTSIDYQWNFVHLLYNYRTSQNVDNISHRQTDNENHSSNIQITKSIWDNKISLSCSYQQSQSDSTTSLSRNSGGYIILDVPSTASFAGLDSSPENGTLASVMQLNDGNTITPTAIGLPDIFNQLNVALQINFNPTNRLQVYFDRQLSAETQQRLHWAIYTSIDGNSWNILHELPTIEYNDEDDQTFALLSIATEIKTARYIKAVISTDIGYNDAFLTEIIAQQSVLITEDKTELTTSNKTQQSQASINYRPWDNIQIGYSFSQNKNNPSNGIISTQKTHSLNGHINWNRYFSLSMNMGESIDLIEGLTKKRSRTYSFSYLTTPIDSVNFSINGTRSNQFEDDLKTQTSDSISSNLTAIIVPDLTSSISYGWSKSVNDGEDSITTSRSYTLNLMARISSRINVSYFLTRQDSTTHRISISYRPSDLISTSFSAMKTDETSSYSSTVHWRITPKIQNNLSYNLTEENSGLTHTTTYNLSWNISQHFSVRKNIKWSEAQGERSWSGLLSVSYNI